MTIDRRRFLGLGVFAAASAAGLRAASGFQLQEMNVPTARAYRLACEAPANHAQLLAEIDAALAGRTLTAEETRAIRAAQRCPLCGCALVAAEAPGSTANAPY
ncbi:MAG: hypothetical protein IT562_15515 [Alphaproteobacteria bacterium]|nr:hypothetical protein [Alphaproteobacteria bacterium]